MSGRSLKVLAITPDYPPAVGGIQLLFHRVLSHAKNLQVRVVTIAAPGAPGNGEAREGNVLRGRNLLDHRLEVLQMNALAVREARREKPDVVLSAHIVCAPGAYVIGRMLGVPTVMYTHAKELGTSPRLAHFAVTNASAVIAVSNYTRSLVLAAGAAPERVHQIAPGVDTVQVETPERFDVPTVLTVARLEDRYKGHDMVIRALPLIRSRVPDVRWVVVGDGQLRNEIIELADVTGVSDSIVLLGRVADHERNHWLDRSHVFVMPSRLPAGKAAGEGFGIVYLEAGVHRLPVVAGNVGGALDAVVDGETGLLVDPTSPMAIADAITGLLLDPERAARMGEAGQRRARAFDWGSTAAKVEELLFATVAGR